MIKTSPRWSKKRLAIVLSVLATACSPIAAKAQAPPWSSPEQIGSGLFYGMAAGGKSVHVVNGNGTVYYHRSTTEGQSWEPAVPLGSGSVYLDRPLYADGQNLYLVYFKHVRDFTDSCCGRETGDLYMRRSTDNGSSWL